LDRRLFLVCCRGLFAAKAAQTRNQFLRIDVARWVRVQPCGPPRNDGNTDELHYSREVARLRVVFSIIAPETRGRRECRVLSRTRSLVYDEKKYTSCSHHRSAEAVRHSPRDGVTAYSALSLVIGLSCHHPPEKRWLLRS